MSAPLKLLIISQGIDGGIAPLTSRLAHGLTQLGLRCRILYIGRPASVSCLDQDRLNRIESRALTTGPARTWREAAGLLRSIGSVCQEEKEFSPDIILFAGFIPGLCYATALRLRSGARFILWDHAPQNTFLNLKKLLFPVALGGIDDFVSISNSTAQALSSFFKIDPRRITLIWNGIDPRPWEAVPPVRDFKLPSVLLPARLDLNQKDHPTLIRAAVLLKERGVDIRVTLAGGGVDEPAVRKLIEDLRATDYIELVPYTNDLPTLMAQHNIVCLATKFEGLGMVLVEAMLAGRVALAANVAGCIDLIEPGVNGFLYRAQTPEDCAEQIQAICQRQDLMQILANARSHALQNFTIDQMVGSFYRLLTQTRA